MKLSPPLAFSSYRAWLNSKRETGLQSLPQNATEMPPEYDAAEMLGKPPSEPGVLRNQPTSEQAEQAKEPAYPSSFARIVELITTGQPISGIQQIPETVLTGHDTSSAKPKRRKPWERDASSALDTDTGAKNIELV